MSSVGLAIIPVRTGRIAVGATEVVAELADLGDCRVVLVGTDIDRANVAETFAGLVERVGVVSTTTNSTPELAAAVQPLLERSALVALPATPDGRDLATALAAGSGRQLISTAESIAADQAVVLWRGGAVRVALARQPGVIVTLQPGVRTVSPVPDPTPVEVVGLDVGALTERAPAAVHLEDLPPDPATVDLAEASRLVGAGAGLLGDDAVRLIEELRQVGEVLGASLGATRVVTDGGLVPHTRQIGTTGVVVDPELYLAFGISGAVQHTAGLGHPNHIISVNTDPHCPMMAMADLAIVADAGPTLDALAEQLDLVTAADSATSQVNSEVNSQVSDR